MTTEPVSVAVCETCHGEVFCTRSDDGPHTLFHEHNGSRYCDIGDDPIYGPNAGGTDA